MLESAATNGRCDFHERDDSKIKKKMSNECGPITNVLASGGADSNPMSFYSTTNSSTHIDWLPNLRKKFQLHLQSKNGAKVADVEVKPKEIRKQATGFTSIVE
jgi:hypothetical protein